MQDLIYADHSATTFIKKDVLDEMMPYLIENYGNASSTYSLGIKSKMAITEARKKVASAIGVKEEENIYFTSGGSEADNMIIKGIAYANKDKGKHIITTKIEHMAVINTCKRLEQEGFEVTYLDVDSSGLININDVQNVIRPDTILISVMFANNEIGTIEPIEQIAKLARFKGIIFHTDAVQAVGNVKIDVEKMCIDALSMSAHKFYGPKGIGAAYINSKINFIPLIEGGHQEFLKRAGTENVAAIVGMGKAIEISTSNLEEKIKGMIETREYMIEKILNNISGVKINGDREKRLPGNVNVSIKGINAENALVILNMNNICASSGSACNSGGGTSHVLLAISKDLNLCREYGSLRFSLGEENTKEDVDYIVEKLKEIVIKLRK